MILNDLTLRPGDHIKALGDSAWHTVTKQDVEETRAAVRAAEEYAAAKPPNPYENSLDALRASEAKASPATSFEETYKAQRRAAFAAEYARGKA